jgi:GNAT superfamily N-acetyltransferase
MATSDIEFRALDPAELARWLGDTRRGYVEERVKAGDSRQDAAANADRSLEQLVPRGSPAPGQLIGRLVHEGEAVGFLWIGPAGTDPQRWWVWDVVIEERLRGRGYGRRAVVLAEDLARSHGARTIGLNVFARNTPARTLYQSMGYEETAAQMRKTL